MSGKNSSDVFDTSFVKEDEAASSRLARKSKEFPFMPIGLAGALMGVLYGAYKFRKRGEMSTSIFLIHLRVAAQGTVVSALSLGVAYTLARDYLFPHDELPPAPEPEPYHAVPHPNPEPHHPKPRK